MLQTLLILVKTLVATIYVIGDGLYCAPRGPLVNISVAVAWVSYATSQQEYHYDELKRCKNWYPITYKQQYVVEGILECFIAVVLFNALANFGNSGRSGKGSSKAESVFKRIRENHSLRIFLVLLLIILKLLFTYWPTSPTPDIITALTHAVDSARSAIVSYCILNETRATARPGTPTPSITNNNINNNISAGSLSGIASLNTMSMSLSRDGLPNTKRGHANYTRSSSYNRAGADASSSYGRSLPQLDSGGGVNSGRGRQASAGNKLGGKMSPLGATSVEASKSKEGETKAPRLITGTQAVADDFVSEEVDIDASSETMPVRHGWD
ncbi:hypothetical protein HDU76_004664 [Blyttiomyces sp. JEL0837]|nr:hypothetical protein HDU76_004664 [Blyttiomyces sp. JEL0837]